VLDDPIKDNLHMGISRSAMQVLWSNINIDISQYRLTDYHQNLG